VIFSFVLDFTIGDNGSQGALQILKADKYLSTLLAWLDNGIEAGAIGQ
jgi:hypothetical protein